SSDNPKTESGDAYLNLLNKISEVPPDYRNKFKGFSQCSIAVLSELTGLAEHSAARAKERQFSEPGIWSGNSEELEVFRSFLKEQGITSQKGGRFLTLSFGFDKVDRMQEIRSKHRSGEQVRFCVALGDAPNDVAMLRAADIGIIIPNPSHNGIEELAAERHGKIMRASRPGPQGWNEAVLYVLDKANKGE
ncbi:MAG: mannosyl-3-phosphoglycerate phosphatase, partial [Pseudomonadota bacterium]